MEKEPLIACTYMLLLISALVLPSCSSVEDASSRQREVAGSQIGKDKVVLYQRESDSVSVSPRSRSFVLQHRW
jgi:hypothetical protein